MRKLAAKLVLAAQVLVGALTLGLATEILWRRLALRHLPTQLSAATIYSVLALCVGVTIVLTLERIKTIRKARLDGTRRTGRS